MTGNIPYYNEMHHAFVSKLQREGYADNVKIIIQKPYPDPISWSNAVRKLVAADVDLIVTYGAPATLSAVRERIKIPIVYSGVYEPIAKGIKSKNVTGISFRVPVSSLIRYLRGVTTVSSLGVIYNEAEEDSVHQLMELMRLSEQYGFEVEKIRLKRPEDANRMLSYKKTDAIFITSSSLVNMAADSIINIAKANRVPTVSLLSGTTGSEAIITLSVKPGEQGEKAAEKVIKILNGIPAERIQAESSRGTELIFNMKEANAMGLRLSMDLITEATRIIK
ncbi:MAG: ABC transporter substrate-binding protein [Nitrospirae bacterium]|nr:ABC transporter substrate-binding protein [Nitrospirota bacterium]